MSVKIKQDLVPSSKHKLKSPYSMVAEFITVHNTANDASAQNEINYMKNNTSSTSFHFAVDDKEVIQGLPLNRNGWHCTDGTNGKGNRKSIGIEICYSKSGGERYEKAEANTIKLIAQLLKERKWTTAKVKQHHYWYPKKNCPHRIRDEKRWNEFIKAIEEEMKPKKVVVKYPGTLIRRGSRGENVKKVQKKVGATADGIFGAKTETAVKAYQKKNKLVVDGIVGQKTWNKMFN